MSRRAPLWLRMPGRYAGLSAGRARILVALIGFALAAAAFSPLPAPNDAMLAIADQEILVRQGIVSAMIAGGDYYTVAADALRQAELPLGSVTAFRLPTLAVVLSSLPWLAGSLLLVAIAFASGWLWLERTRRAIVPRLAPMALAAVALAAGLVGFTQISLIALPEHWAAPLVALSLGLWRPGRWQSAAAIGLIAALLRETAAIYLIVMALAAWAEHHRREALGWLAALAVLAVVMAFHAAAASRAISPLDTDAAASAVAHGPAAMMASLGDQGGWTLLPSPLAAALAVLSMLGWSAWRDPAGLRVAATLAAYALAIMAIGWPAADAWGAMLAPLLLLGLVFAPDALRDIAAAALDTRRVRVHRVTR
ncbi:hypothetical protein [Sphingomonas sp.]